jgi:uncharacterized membrane protein
MLLFGTGGGIASFMLIAHRSAKGGHIFRTARTVVLADFLFTATAVVAQPVTGVLLAGELGLPLRESWRLVSIAPYAVARASWLPVVLWMQMRMRDLSGEAFTRGRPLGADYHRLFPALVLVRFSCVRRGAGGG